MSSRQPMPLLVGQVVEQFSIVELLGPGVDSFGYRVRDVSSGSSFILREYIPAQGAQRSDDGRISGLDEATELSLSVGIAQFQLGLANRASLHHPGLVTASRWFKANGTAYAVTPCPAGKSLASLLVEEGRLSAPQAAGIAMPLLETLEYLHDQGLVHQEINPHLIQVLESGAAVLLGAGAAGLAAPTTLPEEAALQPGAAVEQFRPDGQIGPWTDIYGLSACLYQAIKGEAAPGAAQRLAAIDEGEADLLAPLDLPGNAGRSQREMATLVDRGLALEPSFRPQSVREWRTRMERVTATPGETSNLPRDTQDQDSREWLPKVLLAAFLLLIAALAFYLLTDRWSGGHSAAENEAVVDRTSPEEIERWRQALEVNAVIGYRDFMADYPQSMHLQQAQEHIDMLEDKAWAEVLAEGTKSAFEAHLEVFPEGVHATEAKARIEEFRLEEARLERERQELLRQDDVAWETARSVGSIAALDTYISEWPGGVYLAEAHDLRLKMQGGVNEAAGFAVAQKEHTIEAYRLYIQEFPSGRNVAAAQQAIETLTLRVGKAFRDCSDCPLMTVVPAGAFWQGSGDSSPLAISIEKPRRRVVIAEPFAIGVHEITMAQWDVCVAAGGCETRPADNGWGRGERPVIMVSWSDAQNYAGWLSEKTGQSYSLPSESQWEYAARAGQEGDWPGGDAALLCAYANIAGNETEFDWRHRDCSDGFAFETQPVGSLKANGFGLYDVIGNVAEWTLDCMNLSYLEAPADGSAWTRGMCSSRMTRGGSWFTGTKESRLSARFNLKNGDRNDFTGFRLVRRVEKL